MKRDTVENQGSATLFLTYQVFHEKQVFLNIKIWFSLSKIMSKAIWSPQVMDTKKFEGTHKGRIEEDWGCQQIYKGVETFLE